MKGKIAINEAFDYVESVTESDISKLDGVRRNPDAARRIMRSYARLQGTQSANTVIAADIDFAYRRKDGVIVCPIGCLRP